MAVSFRRDLTLNDGTIIWLRKDTGIVESVKDWSETHVSSSGGGGNLSGGTGYVSAPTISSRSVHRQVFFVKYEDVAQKEFDTTLIGVAVGHKVSEVCGAKQGIDSGHYLGLYNHTTNTYAFYGLKQYKCGDFGQRRVWFMPFAVYLIFLFVLFVVFGIHALWNGPARPTDFANLVFYVFVLSIPVYVVRRYRRGKFYKDLTSKVLAFMREG
jgi:hypothetical protein